MPATASDYIHHIDDIPPGPVVLLVRVSTPSQRKHLKPQEDDLCWEFERKGYDVRAIVREIGYGREYCRPDFDRAVQEAKKHGATLGATAVNRFIRSGDSEAERQMKWGPTGSEMDQLMRMADGVRLATLLHPDTPPRQVRSYESKRGQASSRKRGGRLKGPMSKKRRRERILPRVLELHGWELSLRDIEAETGVAFRTVGDWIKRYAKG